MVVGDWLKQISSKAAFCVNYNCMCWSCSVKGCSCALLRVWSISCSLSPLFASYFETLCSWCSSVFLLKPAGLCWPQPLRNNQYKPRNLRDQNHFSRKDEKKRILSHALARNRLGENRSFVLEKTRPNQSNSHPSHIRMSKI